MICISCQGTIKIVSEIFKKKTNTVERTRSCKTCGIRLKTNEKILKSEINKKEWMNYRFILYARYRMIGMMAGRKKLFKKNLILHDKNKHKITNDFDWGFYKKSGKTGIYVRYGKEEHPLILQIESKKKTIKMILRLKEYWEKRKSLFEETSLEDMRNKEVVNYEAHKFFRSVTQYIRKKEYNQNFFIKNDKRLSEFWKDSDVWQFYLHGR